MPNGIQVPQHVASERNLAMAAAANISQIRSNFSLAIYQRVIAKTYWRELDNAHQDDPQSVIRDNVDCNNEAVFAIHAANVLMHHLGILRTEEEAHRLLGQPSEPASKIVT